MTVQRVELPTDPAERLVQAERIREQAAAEKRVAELESQAALARAKADFQELDTFLQDLRDQDNRDLEARVAVKLAAKKFLAQIAETEQALAQLERDRQRRAEAAEVKQQAAELDAKRQEQMFALRMRAASAMHRIDCSEAEALAWYEQQRTARPAAQERAAPGPDDEDDQRLGGRAAYLFGRQSELQRHDAHRAARIGS